MCQLLGLSASQPVSAAFSLGGFLLRGGRTGHHVDGWGLGFYHGRQCHLLTDERPAAESPLASDLEARSVRAANLIAHVRKATQGRVRQSNCHPFQRTLWGREWLFAHNGDLRGQWTVPDGPYFAFGETDSERAFCTILNGLVARFGALEPASARLAECVAELAGTLAIHGTFNFLLSNGDLLFARCSTELHFVERSWPFSSARLIDSDEVIDFARHNHRGDRVIVIATSPLTSDEPWQRLQAGELRVFRRGASLPDLGCQVREELRRFDSPESQALSAGR
jgi:glutamine amidotransferase